MTVKFKTAALAMGISLAAASTTNAAIIGAMDATINAGGPGFGTLQGTFDQSGLSSRYISGVTDFASFVATTTHAHEFAENEWFSERGITQASVTYNLGAVNNVDSLALWNEDAAGIGTLDLSVSSDGVNFTHLLSGLEPVQNDFDTDYAAEVFSFAATAFQFIRFDMSDCPRGGGTFRGCAIGEVAFNAVRVSDVPVPAGLPLLLGGLGVFGYMRRRKQA